MNEDDFSCLRFERHVPSDDGAGEVLEVVIDRADSRFNAVDGELHHDLTRLFPLLQAERSARAVLLTGTGPAFSAGGDFGWFPTLQDRTTLENLRLDARQMIFDLLDVHLPIVAAVNGHAMGLGASLALLCDVIFMARSATIGDPHVKVGIVAGDGGTLAWPMAVGPARAKQYLLTGDPVAAEEAERIGLVNGVFDDDELHGAALGVRPSSGRRRPARDPVHEGRRQRHPQGRGQPHVRSGGSLRDRHVLHRRSPRGVGCAHREANATVRRLLTRQRPQVSPHLDMKRSRSTITRTTLPTATRPRASEADTLNVNRRPSTLDNVASAVTDAPTGDGCMWSTRTFIPTVVWPSGSSFSMARQLACSHSAMTRGVPSTSTLTRAQRARGVGFSDDHRHFGPAAHSDTHGARR